MHRADVSKSSMPATQGARGELIFRFVYEMAGCKKPMRRLWISSMEDSAIKEGFSRLKNGRDYDLSLLPAIMQGKSRLANRYQCHPPFFCPPQSYQNVGRVQTPTLKCLLTGTQRLPHFQERKILPCTPCIIRRGSCKVNEFQIRQKPTH